MNQTLYDTLPPILTAKDLSNFLHISRASSYNLFNAKDFPTLKIGRSKRVTREHLIDWMNSHTDYINGDCYESKR